MDEEDEKFVNKFAFKFIIFDPLDRNLGTFDDNGIETSNATSTKELKQLIIDSTEIDCQNLSAPFSEEVLILLEKLINKDFLALNQILENYVAEAKLIGTSFDKEI